MLDVKRERKMAEDACVLRRMQGDYKTSTT